MQYTSYADSGRQQSGADQWVSSVGLVITESDPAARRVVRSQASRSRRADLDVRCNVRLYMQRRQSPQQKCTHKNSAMYTCFERMTQAEPITATMQYTVFAALL